MDFQQVLAEEEETSLAEVLDIAVDDEGRAMINGVWYALIETDAAYDEWGDQVAATFKFVRLWDPFDARKESTA